MSAFENKTPETIVPTDVDALIGRTENQRLEFKETINDVTSYELAKDLGSFAPKMPAAWPVERARLGTTDQAGTIYSSETFALNRPELYPKGVKERELWTCR